MRPRLADPELSLAMTLIWIGVLLAALGGCPEFCV
jgi:hypothetical protein